MAIRTASVDWKEHPSELMAHLDRLAGAQWRSDPDRWVIADSLDLDHLIAQPFLQVVQPTFLAAGLAIVEVVTGDDTVTFGVVPESGVAAAITAWAKDKKTKLVRVQPSKAGKGAQRQSGAKTKISAAAKKEALEAKAARGELDSRLARADSVDVGVVWPFQALYPTRILMSSGAPESEIRKLLDLTVDLAIASFEINGFITHGPQIDSEVLGAALLMGRGGELVRAMAHVHSLGARSKTALWKVFLGRDLPATWSRGATTELDRLLLAPKAKLAKAIEKHLTGVWSTYARGMKGSRASLLASALVARASISHRAIAAPLHRYLTTLPLLPDRKPNAHIVVDAPPKFVTPAGAPREMSRGQEELLQRARAWAGFVAESVQHAKKERSGMYLRSLPETAVDIATLLYAAGAAVEDVERWLTWAVDLDIARCTGTFDEDVLAMGLRTHVVAGAAVLVGKDKALAKAWAARSGDARLPALRAWLAGKRPKSAGALPKKPLAKAIVAVVTGGDPKKFTSQAGVFPHESKESWPGPFDAFATALAKRGRLNAPQVMTELLGAKAPETAKIGYGEPRLALPDAKAISASAERVVATGGEPLDLARSCLVVARCQWSLGAPPKTVGEWLRKSVDFAKRAKHLDEDLLGAARLVARAPELVKSLHVWSGAPDGAAPERAFAKVLTAYAKGSPPPPHEAALSKRHFYAELARAIRAAREHDAAGLRKALARAPWQHRREWTSGDNRKRPPYWSFMLTAIAADMGTIDALPPASQPFASADLVAWSRAGAL